jgi:hypothetical protein
MASRKSERAFLQDDTKTGTALTPADASAFFRLNSDGNAEDAPTSGTFTVRFAWLVSRTNADFECRMTATTGTFGSGSVGTWVALSTSRTWGKTRTNNAVGTDTVIGTLEIRAAVSQIVLASCTITLNAEVFV